MAWVGLPPKATFGDGVVGRTRGSHGVFLLVGEAEPRVPLGPTMHAQADHQGRASRAAGRWAETPPWGPASSSGWQGSQQSPRPGPILNSLEPLHGARGLSQLTTQDQQRPFAEDGVHHPEFPEVLIGGEHRADLAPPEEGTARPVTGETRGSPQGHLKAVTASEHSVSCLDPKRGRTRSALLLGSLLGQDLGHAAAFQACAAQGPGLLTPGQGQGRL